MPTISFYQVLGDTPGAVDAVLPRLLDKATAAGAKVLLVCPAAARQLRLDESLWTFDASGFLPHGLAGQPHEDRQPILLTHAEADGIAARAEGRLPLLLAGSESLLAGEGALGAPERTLYVFESAPAVLERARATWKALKSREGITLESWKQTEKGWSRP
jgi:DNA polymerase-3 subunit chi